MQKPSILRFLTIKAFWVYSSTIFITICCILFALFFGSVKVPVEQILHIVSSNTIGYGWLATVPLNIEMIIWDIRLPRVLLAFVVGASLALAGAAFQGLLRNPLADPYTIGVSSGAALGAVLTLFFKLSLFGLGVYTLPFMAIVGAFVALVIVFGLTRMASRTFAIETIILAGIILGSFIGAIISLIVALSDQDNMRQILYWLMGSVGSKGWGHVQLILPFFAVGALMLLLNTRELNALALGEQSAQNLGVNVQRRKIFILIGASILTGASVAVSGQIGFVGLVIPHLVRLVMGPNHRHLLPLSIIVGGAYLVIADLVARMIIAPQELPIGVITALIGAPIFALLLFRQKAGKRGS